MSLSPRSPLLAQLRVLCEAHPTAPKVVFVPRVQLGQAIETALARNTGDWAGLTCCVPIHYARKIAQWNIITSGRDELTREGRRIWIAAFLEEMGASGQMDGLPAPRHFWRPASEAVETLRLNGVAAGSVQKRAKRQRAGAAFRVLSACYERYHAGLERERLFDEADVLRWAADRLKNSPPRNVSSTVFTVCDETELLTLDAEFLQALKNHGVAFYRLGEQGDEAAPLTTAARIFKDAPLPLTSRNTNGRKGPVTTQRAIGPENEVRALFRDILISGEPLDEVEIAYTASAPYLMLIADTARKAGIPVTVGPGHSALQSRTGQALRGFCEWIEDDYDVKPLIRLLRGGLLRIDSEEDVTAHEIATMLASRAYEPGRDGIEKAFQEARKDRSSRSRQRRIIEAAHRLVRSLWQEVDGSDERMSLRGVREADDAAISSGMATKPMEIASPSARNDVRSDLKNFAKAARSFIKKFGPVDPPSDGEETRTYEQAARGSILEKLESVERLPIRFEAEPSILASTFHHMLEKQFAPPERPRAGSIHVAPLASAGYGGRRHLYVVGMDSETLSEPATENLMLRDADLAVIGMDYSTTTAAEQAAWLHERTLRRHTGALSLYSSVYDTAKGEERYPSALFLDMEVDSNKTLAGFVPAGGASLDDRDAWLRSRAGAADAAERPAREAIAAAYPWIASGERAREHAEADHFTEYDGLLVGEAFANLDFTNSAYDGPPMSAGRLETLAETPYLYFLKYILRIKPLEEPALEETEWLDKLESGILLHEVFEKFMKRVGKTPITRAHEGLLMDVLDAAIDRRRKKVAPPNERIAEAVRRRLENDARVFLHAEVEAAGQAEPFRHELGFGNEPRHSKEGDLGEVRLAISEDIQIPLRGRIDRIDRLPDGTLAVWDYKTGKAKKWKNTKYGKPDPFTNGALLQWALYGSVVAQALDEKVSRSGYFFATTDEMGMRISEDPGPHRERMNELIVRLGKMAAAGCFPMNKGADTIDSWKYKGFDPVFANLENRATQLKEKTYPDEWPEPLKMK